MNEGNESNVVISSLNTKEQSKIDIHGHKN
jgi:hypothetical protein